MITTEKMKNGVDVEKLGATIEAVQNDPSLAKFEFRAKNNWINGHRGGLPRADITH